MLVYKDNLPSYEIKILSYHIHIKYPSGGFLISLHSLNHCRSGLRFFVKGKLKAQYQRWKLCVLSSSEVCFYTNKWVLFYRTQNEQVSDQSN